MQKLWDGLALLAGIGGMLLFASFAIWVLPFLAAITFFGFCAFVGIALIKVAVQALGGKNSGG